MTSSEQKCSLEDIRDVVGFAKWTVVKTYPPADDGLYCDLRYEIYEDHYHCPIPLDGRREMESQAVVELLHLHRRWERRKCRRFSAYCLTYLPLRLIDWWRRDLRQQGILRGRNGNTEYVPPAKPWELDRYLSTLRDEIPYELIHRGVPSEEWFRA